MDKLILQGGGHPLTVEDLLFMQQSWRDGFAAAMSLFFSTGYASFLISGCEKTAAATPGYVDMSAGYIFHDGEIWAVDEALNIPDADIYFAPEISYQAPSPVTYASGADVDVKQVRKMIVGNDIAIPSGGVSYAELPVLWQLLQKKGTGWQTPVFHLGVSGLSGSLEPGWRVIATGQVVMRGRISVNMAIAVPGSSQQIVLSLPEWVAPARPRTFTTTTNNGKLIRLIVSQQSGFCNVSIATTSGASFTDAGYSGETVIIPLDSLFHLINE